MFHPFSLSRPLGRVSLVVAMSVYVYVYVYICPHISPLSLALRWHDQFGICGIFFIRQKCFRLSGNISILRYILKCMLCVINVNNHWAMKLVKLMQNIQLEILLCFIMVIFIHFFYVFTFQLLKIAVFKSVKLIWQRFVNQNILANLSSI